MLACVQCREQQKIPWHRLQIKGAVSDMCWNHTPLPFHFISDQAEAIFIDSIPPTTVPVTYSTLVLNISNKQFYRTGQDTLPGRRGMVHFFFFSLSLSVSITPALRALGNGLVCFSLRSLLKKITLRIHLRVTYRIL